MDLFTKKKLERDDFDRKQPISEVMVDFEELDKAHPNIIVMLKSKDEYQQCQVKHEVVSPHALHELY